MLVGADRRRAGGAAGTTATTRTGPVGQGWLAMLDSIPNALAVHRATIYVQDEGLARKRFGVVRPSADADPAVLGDYERGLAGAVRPAGVGITFPTEQGLRCGAACDAVGYLAAQRDGRGYSDLDIDRQVLVPALNLRVMEGMFDVGAVEHGLAATTGARDGITAPLGAVPSAGSFAA